MATKTTSKKRTAKPTAKKATELTVSRSRQVTGSGDARFVEVIALIERARARGYQAVNTVLVEHYWELGAYISRKIATAEWGDGVAEDLATDLAWRYPGRAATRPNLFRMRQFYEAYRSNPKVSGQYGLAYLDDGSDPAQRLFVVSAGNVAELRANHLDGSDTDPVHDPGQAWNALTVGGFTDKAVISDPKWKSW